MEAYKVIINRSPLRFQRSGVAYYTRLLIESLQQTEITENLLYHDFGFGLPIPKAAKEFLVKILGNDLYTKLKNSQYKRSLQRILSHLPHNKAIYHETNNLPATDLSLSYVTTLQDLSVFKFPSYHPSHRVKFFGDNFQRTLDSNIIVVPSHSTRKDLMDMFAVPPEKIRVVAHGRNEFYRMIDPTQAHKIAKRYVDKPFILFSGIIEPRKNISNLILAFGLLRKKKDLALVIAGGFGWHYDSIVNLPRKLGLRDVLFTGYVSEEDLRGLYNRAQIFIYPSFYEGFGFPPLEAMACGAPVVLSNVSSLPEVGGEAAVYVDPCSVESIAEGMFRLLEDKALTQAMREGGLERCRNFTWSKTATQMIEIYNELALR
jgi:glycosyltransferase involved in cell wall biosynthesis